MLVVRCISIVNKVIFKIFFLTFIIHSLLILADWVVTKGVMALSLYTVFYNDTAGCWDENKANVRSENKSQPVCVKVTVKQKTGCKLGILSCTTVWGPMSHSSQVLMVLFLSENIIPPELTLYNNCFVEMVQTASRELRRDIRCVNAIFFVSFEAVYSSFPVMKYPATGRCWLALNDKQ